MWSTALRTARRSRRLSVRPYPTHTHEAVFPATAYRQDVRRHDGRLTARRGSSDDYAAVIAFVVAARPRVPARRKRLRGDAHGRRLPLMRDACRGRRPSGLLLLIRVAAGVAVLVSCVRPQHVGFLELFHVYRTATYNGWVRCTAQLLPAGFSS
jgi:hypothetical protein